MKYLIIKDNVPIETDKINSQSVLMVSDVFFKEEIINGEYDFYFIYDNYKELRLNSIMIDKNIKLNKWNKVSFKYMVGKPIKTNISPNIRVTMKLKLPTEFSEKYVKSNNDVKKNVATMPYNCSYKLIILNTDDDYQNFTHEDVNRYTDPTYCFEITDVKSENKILGASCPINDGYEMPYCLNWRRTDSLGLFCRTNLSATEKNQSILNFCYDNPLSVDCRCMNRREFPQYQESSSYNNQNLHDYCWYPDCRYGNYLKLIDDNILDCHSEECKIIFNEVFDGKIEVQCSPKMNPMDEILPGSTLNSSIKPYSNYVGSSINPIKLNNNNSSLKPNISTTNINATNLSVSPISRLDSNYNIDSRDSINTNSLYSNFSTNNRYGNIIDTKNLNYFLIASAVIVLFFIILRNV